MAAEGEDERMVLDQDEDHDAKRVDSSSDSEKDGSGQEAEDDTAVEWLATSRAKRSTAGNRMKTMLAAEAPDDELELLFAEDGDDAGFTEVEDDGSDMQMDSSDDDDDAHENADGDDGERELERQARENRQAARKRKGRDAIPVKFRKKVRISTSTSASNVAGPSNESPAPAPAPPPRRKKKSERASWLPSGADLPTRASKRETTMLSKEQLHQQMIEREVKRIKQVEAMERKAQKMEALRKPPMTQAQRLAEAAIIEKRNAKSLNRWEEAEKQRGEERRAKLAALNNRSLAGPVVTFWSGVGEWMEGNLKHVGKIVSVEEKPARKKRASVIASDEFHRGPDKVDKEKELPFRPDMWASSISDQAEAAPSAPTQAPVLTENRFAVQAATGGPSPQEKPAVALATPLAETGRTRVTEPGPLEMKPADCTPYAANLYTTSKFAPPSSAQLMKAPETRPSSSSFLAPPAGVAQDRLSMPMIGYTGTPNMSNVLAPPSTAPRSSQFPMPYALQASAQAPYSPNSFTPTSSQPPIPLGNLKPSHTNMPRKPAPASFLPHPPPPPRSPPPPSGKATRNCIILQNFDENAIRDKAVQIRILFGKEMSKLSKPTPPPRCVITNYPARYKDPKTGLPYYNSYAFQEIQRLCRGEYKWSALIGAWVGRSSFAATGVPPRFQDPNALPPPPLRPPPPDLMMPALPAPPMPVNHPGYLGPGSLKTPIPPAELPPAAAAEPQRKIPAPGSAYAHGGIATTPLDAAGSVSNPAMAPSVMTTTHASDTGARPQVTG